MSPDQRKAVEIACKLLRGGGLPNIPTIVQGGHAYVDMRGEGDTAEGELLATAMHQILDSYRVPADIVLPGGTPVRHIPSASGSTIAFLRHGSEITPAEKVVYAMRVQASETPTARTTDAAHEEAVRFSMFAESPR